MTNAVSTIRVPGQFATGAALSAWSRKPSGLAPAPVAPDHMFTIAPHAMEAFGALVKSWAKSPETAPVGKHSVESFAAILEAHGIDYTLPTRAGCELREVNVSLAEAGVLELRVPARAMIEASERMLAESEYPLPSYCADVFPGATPEIDDNLELHRKRVADYCILNCA
ncbi:hypothetical protein [uncultured Albimonas sp.]|uniref:hypothetical protein n=1 Tax=uncultured Albimonas sp. TaxID=1331701 RepID=UPI0030EDF09C